MGHYGMYPDGITNVYSYFESRSGAKFNATVFFGLQYLIKKNLLGQVVTKEKIKMGKELIDQHLGPGIFNEKGWNYILNNFDGKLPVRIKAVPEGMAIPTNNVIMTVENTDPNCFWLTNHLETLLTHVWSSSTCATLSREIKILFKYYLDLTASSNFQGIDFMLHDFGYRGVSSVESAGIEGAGHLVNFKGTDTIRGIETAIKYYHSDVCGYSVPATEHSIMTSRGQEGEKELLKDLCKKYNSGILSIVIDSYDFENFISEVSKSCKEEILNRNGKTVFRPDSGEPVSTTILVLELLKSIFGCQVNDKGYKVLNEKIGVLWGDGIDYLGIRNILHAMKAAAWSAENIVFGMGGGLLQKINRDDQRFAFKCSAQCVNGEWREIFKKPKDISKMSKKGRFSLNKEGENYITVKEGTGVDILETVFENGELLIDRTFEEIRRNAAI